MAALHLAIATLLAQQPLLVVRAQVVDRRHCGGGCQTGGLLARREFGGWPLGTKFRVDHAMRDIALETIARCVFGVHGPRVREASTLTKEWLDVAFSPEMFLAGMVLSSGRVRSTLDALARDSPARLGRSTFHRVLPWQRLADKKARLLRLLEVEVRAARARGVEAGRQDVLSKLVAARFEDGTSMSDEHVVDELVTLLIGGQETTATALTWALNDLLPRADVMRRATTEIDAEFPDGVVDPARVGRLVYLEACIRESMRRRPVAVAVPRFLLRPLRLRKTTVPPGAYVWACTFLSHHAPEVYAEPDAFRPERFLEAKPTGDEHYPFGGGRRRCAGMAFAAVEMRVVLAELLATTELELAPDATARPIMRGITLAPEDGVPVVLRRRRAAATGAR